MMLLVKLPGPLEHEVRKCIYIWELCLIPYTYNSFTERGAVKKGRPKATIFYRHFAGYRKGVSHHEVGQL